ncbi:MAG: lytic transglycosylase domain-containing protein [Pseudobacteriovorax sp.]|nr:lytic transglycosylase domain-containing protein [Pseudobacteriovorax sp.]
MLSRILGLFGFICLFGSVTAESKVRFDHFPVPKTVEKQVSFWKKIFAEYNTKHTVIHDRNHPDVIIDVIDFKAFEHRFNNGRAYTPQERRRITAKYLNRYRLAISRVRKVGARASKFGAMERRILEVYKRHNIGITNRRNKTPQIRSQRGLSDEFAVAINRSARYLPYIEDIFRSRSLPIDLTRIPFVESMFNEKAVSKVGASGIWQFMPLTGKQFMNVNKFIDERNSPIKATRAAADLLSSNYRAIKSWPLAITAYNHGLSGMQRAVRQLNTKNLETIIHKYKSPTFGFASKNFYAEFVAANQVYNSMRQQVTGDRNPLRITQITLKERLSLHELIRKTPLDEKTIRTYNKCIKKNTYTRYKHRPLPKNFKLIVPERLTASISRYIKVYASTGKSMTRFTL